MALVFHFRAVLHGIDSSEILGFEVDALNSVQFSNHKGYEVCKGQVLNSEELGEVFEGLQANKLHHYSHLLTGFIGSKSFLLKVCDVVAELRRENPKLIYVCDPVMGDNGRMYVPEDLLPVYRDKVLPLADIVTPNQYEAELLTGIKINTEEAAKLAMKKLHDLGAKTVVISSSDLGSSDVLIALGSCVHNGTVSGVRMEIPHFPASFVGTGDLFAALLMAWLYKQPDNLKEACEKTMSTLQHILKSTLMHARETAGYDERPAIAHMELKLIQNKDHIENPQICVKATTL